MGCKSSHAGAGEAAKIDKPEVVFVVGGPGSGKGTQCDKIIEAYGYKHLSTGDLLRKEKETGSEMAEKINLFMNEGKLVPTELLIGLLKQGMKDGGWEQSKFLVDGFPRNQENVDVWNKEIGNEVRIKFVLFFDVDEDTMKSRLLKRGETSGRADDNEATI
jgi:adenylate kinase family enzyme